MLECGLLETLSVFLFALQVSGQLPFLHAAERCEHPGKIHLQEEPSLPTLVLLLLSCCFDLIQQVSDNPYSCQFFIAEYQRSQLAAYTPPYG